MAYKGIINYSDEYGLRVSTKAEIMEDLQNICKDSYGADFVAAEGTEMYTLLDILANTLFAGGSSAKDLYDAFTFTSATGTALESLCSLAGIYRYDGESDIHLRNRYYKYLYRQSVGTIEGLTAKILALNEQLRGEESNQPIQDVRIFENDSDSEKALPNSSPAITIPGHTIVVSVQMDPDFDDAYEGDWQSIIDNVITNYKSLGCGVYKFTLGSNTHLFEQANFATYTKCTLSITFDSAKISSQMQDALWGKIQENIINYVNSLGLGGTILYSGIMKCCYDAQEYIQNTDDIMTINSIKFTPRTGTDITLSAENDNISHSILYLPWLQSVVKGA